MLSMGADSAPIFGILEAQRHSHSWESGIARLSRVRTRETLAKNLAALMDARPDLDTFKKITAATNGSLSNGTLDRVRRATHSTSVDTLGELAAVFGLEPWQLLVVGLNPKRLPVLASKELIQEILRSVPRESTSDTAAQEQTDSSVAVTTESPKGARSRVKGMGVDLWGSDVNKAGGKQPGRVQKPGRG